MPTAVVHPRPAPPDPEQLARAAKLATPILSDSMDRQGGLPGILPIPDVGGTLPLAGPALTVRTTPGDNLLVHHAVDLAEPGEVLVIDAGGDPTRAIVGEMICLWALQRGARGVVVNGAVRDVAALAGLDLPVFATGVSHLGPWKAGSGEIRGILLVGHTVVRAGDVIVGDEDGVAVVPAGNLAAVLDLAEATVAKEEGFRQEILSGHWNRPFIENLHVVEVAD